jgi:hypothetical protein
MIVSVENCCARFENKSSSVPPPVDLADHYQENDVANTPIMLGELFATTTISAISRTEAHKP